MSAAVPLPPPSPAARGGYTVGLVGEGIGRSLTPALHEVEAAALGLPYEYRIIDLLDAGADADPIGDILHAAAAAGYAAMNVTHPCKQLAAAAVDELDDDAARLGAVNLVTFHDGRLVGHNTDWFGFADALEKGLPGAVLDHVAQLGAGGAGAATAYALLRNGTQRLTIADTSVAQREALAERLRDLYPERRVDATDGDGFEAALPRVDGVVHATPVGMAQHPGVAFDVDLLPPSAWIAEVVYRPLETELVRRARTTGRATLDGGGMAVGQAAQSLRIITGLEPDTARMEQHFRELVRRESAEPAPGGAGGAPSASGEGRAT